MLSQIDVLKFLITKGQGRTQLELSEAIHGNSAYQQQVNQECQLLVARGEVERRGQGRHGRSLPLLPYPAVRDGLRGA
jgi:hypothetical protein